jgi:ubiquinone/menaquinone biosynthesis C-methylase UbiE
MKDFGQNIDFWTNHWTKAEIESEIRMWDFFGGRPWILKYTPRYGKVLEAGCGLGRYNFYLSNLGIDTIGLDFSDKTIDYLNDWKKNNRYNNVRFVKGDIKSLPFENESLSGYLSFGVIEHFQEGPEKALSEAFRVLRPGGVAIITTPNRSWNIIRSKVYSSIKNLIKILIGKKKAKVFYQYEYTPCQLKGFVQKSGLTVTEYTGTDFFYSFNEFFKFKNNKANRLFFSKLSHFLDKSIFKFLGAQSITISIKVADKMHCFFCDEMTANRSSLITFNVPTCEKCKNTAIAKQYVKHNKTRFHRNYIIDRDLLLVENRKCSFCGDIYKTDILFEDFGFNKNVCQQCLKQKDVNLMLANANILPIWRMR